MLLYNDLVAVIRYDDKTGIFTWIAGKNTGEIAGCLRADGYRMIRLGGILYYAHRLAWFFHNKEMPRQFIDHVNGDKSDNRIDNLRAVSVRVNTENQRGARVDNKSSGLLGVQRNHSGWQACITAYGKRRCLGTFKTPEEAHAVYLSAKRKIHEGCTI